MMRLSALGAISRTASLGFLVIVLDAFLPSPVLGQVPVLTRSYDNQRTGANIHEQKLTPANIHSLKKVRELKVDADDDPRLEAQPLYVPQVRMRDGTIHDVVYVATMANRVYAFDVNDGSILWKQPLGQPINPRKLMKTPYGQMQTELDLYGINLRWGILSTPVIDLDTHTMYVVSWSSVDGTVAQAIHRLHALDVTDGRERHPPLQLRAASPVNHAASFNSPRQKQRAALVLVPLRQTGGPPVKKTLFIAFSQFGESLDGEHGWVLAVDVDTFTQTAAWCSTPRSGGGGIWQSGQGPAADEQGHVYLMTSNGGWDGETDFAESFIKLTYRPSPGPDIAGELTVTDWFTPFRDKDRHKITGSTYDPKDQDLGSGGPILPPGLQLLLGSGKDGVLYVLDKEHLGKSLADFSKLKPPNTAAFFTYFPGFDKNPLSDLDFLFEGKTHHLHGSPVYWPEKSLLFVWGESAALRAWQLHPDGRVTFLAQSHETASAFSSHADAMTGGMVTLSANGPQNGLVWGTVPIKGVWEGRQTEGDANKEIVEGYLRAYDATTFDATDNPDGTKRLKLLWESKHMPNSAFTYNKFCPPFVADGKVFLTTYDGRVDVYGLP